MLLVEPFPKLYCLLNSYFLFLDLTVIYLYSTQWDMSGLYFYFVHSLTVKLSVLALYHRIFGINKVYKYWIYGLGIAQAVLAMIFCIAQAFHCEPFNRYFDRSIPGSCKDDGMVVLSGETPNSLIDFAMVLLAIYMIQGLQLSTGVRWKLTVLFGLGSL